MEQESDCSELKKSTADTLPTSPIDATNERFDPLQALYAPSVSNVRCDVKVYDNLAQFDAALVRVGVLGVGSKAAQVVKPKPKPTKPDDKKYLDLPGRKFLAHQAPIPTAGIKKKHTRNLFLRMEETTGPLQLLFKYVNEGARVKVYTRKLKGVRGYVTGILQAFDKNWNVLLYNACEVWKRRKYRCSENPVCRAVAKDCSERLKKLGIKLPQIEVKTLNQKYVECTQRSKQLMIRGEHVVLITTDKM